MGVSVVRKIAFFLCCLLCLGVFAPKAHAQAPAVSGDACVLMAADGRLLYEKNARKVLPIASTTKLLTALVVLENCSLSDVVRIPASCCGLEGSSMYLQAGERYTVEELLLGLLLVSGNDAASALALHCAGSEEAFAALMNEKAREIGMADSFFCNPHGLPQEGHGSTAYDMALLMHRCLENEDLIRIAGTKSASIRGNTFLNHNKLLYLCPGCLGGKTGYTLSAGRCLVSACQREGAALVCVTLSAPDDWEDHRALYNWAYDSFSFYDPALKLQPQIPLMSSPPAMLSLRAEGDMLCLAEGEQLRAELFLPSFVFPPVEAGEKLGFYRLYREKELVAEGSLYCSQSIENTGNESI